MSIKMKIDEVTCPSCSPPEKQPSLPDESKDTTTAPNRENVTKNGCPFCSKGRDEGGEKKCTKGDTDDDDPAGVTPPESSTVSPAIECGQDEVCREKPQPFKYVIPTVSPKAEEERPSRTTKSRISPAQRAPVKNEKKMKIKTEPGRVPGKREKKTKEPERAPGQIEKKLKELEVDGKVYRLRRRQMGKIDWKREPRYEVKHTATSRLRHDYWFADCGRLKVKAFRGDWSNFPPELLKDWEIYQNYFKYRRKAPKKHSSLVKKIVHGKLVPRVPAPTRKPFSKRSPMKRVASSPASYRRHFSVTTRPRVDFAFMRAAEQPLMEVRGTVTSERRQNSEREPCAKPELPIFWHGSSNELDDVKKKVADRRRREKEQWKQLVTDHRAVKFTDTDKLQQLIVMTRDGQRLENPAVLARTPSVPSTKKSGGVADLDGGATFERNGNSGIGGARPTMVESLSRATAGESGSELRCSVGGVAASGCGCSNSYVLGGLASAEAVGAEVRNEDVTKTPNPRIKLKNLDTVAKWMLPPTIPIQQNLTSAIRRKMKELT